MSNVSLNGMNAGRSKAAAAAINASKSLIKESDFDDFPQVNVIQLIKLIKEVSAKEKTAKEAAQEFGIPYVAFAKVFIVNKTKELLLGEEEQSNKKASNTTKTSKSAEKAATEKKTSKPGTNTSKTRAASAAKTNPNANAKTQSKQEASKSGMQDTLESVAKKLINEAAARAGMESLSDTDFSEKLIACTISTATLVQQYMDRKITDEVFIEKLGGDQIKELTMQVLKASNMDVQLADQLGIQKLGEIGNMAPSTVAFLALTAAYKMVRQAEKEMKLARAQRIEIETACNESIALIRQYRQEMEDVVNNYLTERIETFESGFKAMDKAILENDTDGYISGNIEIQKILGYDVQFTNQEEFDDLMDSDEAFKL